MHADPPVPEPVILDVNDVDLEAMRADYLRRTRGVPRPVFLLIGVFYVALGIFDVVSHRELWWFWIATGVIFAAFSLRAGKEFPAVVRATSLRFSKTGLDVDVAFENKPQRQYPWPRIYKIHDIGESFVLVPRLGRRIVLPKRAFSDGGAEAWAFFDAHHVIGRGERRPVR